MMAGASAPDIGTPAAVKIKRQTFNAVRWVVSDASWLTISS